MWHLRDGLGIWITWLEQNVQVSSAQKSSYGQRCLAAAPKKAVEQLTFSQQKRQADGQNCLRWPTMKPHFTFKRSKVMRKQ